MAARVLVVEDDTTVSEVISAYLERDGHDCRVAANGPAGEQEWSQWRPDLVVLDVMLPGASGWRSCGAGAPPGTRPRW